MKLIHIIPDDKFWDVPITIFDGIGFQNEYVSIVDRVDQDCFFIDKKKVQVIAKNESDRLWTQNDADIFVFHSLSYASYDYVLSIPRNKIVIWASWGYDIYYPQGLCPPICDLNLLKGLTLKFKRRLESPSFEKILIRKFRSVFRKAGVQAKHMQVVEREKALEKQNQVIERVNFCSTILPNEFELLRQHPHFHAKYFPFQYTRRSLTDTYQTITDSSNYILIGNSADWSNNHFDIINKLKRIGVSNTLYFPVVYGDGKCRDMLSQFLHKNVKHYIIQDKLIPYEQYKNNLQKCSVAIFGHIRQQAMGNIYICLTQGCKVFLYKESIAYQFLKNSGFAVFSINDDLSVESIASRLSPEEVEENRRKLADFESIEVVKSHISSFLSSLM